jgi:FkbM family methyltransferase
MQFGLCILALVSTVHAIKLQDPDESAAPQNGKLVFDVGMNRGDDTKMYLDMGYNVVSIEANPTWANKVGALLKNDMASGKLKIENVAISNAKDGSGLTFYIPKSKPRGWTDMFARFFSPVVITSNFEGSKLMNESAGVDTLLAHVDETSSLSKQRACGFLHCDELFSTCECQSIEVKATTCADLIEKHGTPHYLKVDVEGFDGHCMRSLATMPCSKLPQFISFEEQSVWEGSVAGSAELIEALSARGYTWKVSRQDLALHAKLGTGPFGEEASDYVHGKEWTAGTEAKKQATAYCWKNGSPDAQYDCDVHGKFDMSKCTEA